MIRRLSLARLGPDAQPIRLLAVSDEAERAFDFERNRADLGPIDGILGAGDLEPHYLSFLADAFRAPLIYVRGNHDRGANWSALDRQLPRPLDARFEKLAGVKVAGLCWPGDAGVQAVRDESAAWLQAFALALRARGERPLIVLSHVPPRGLGDTPEDHYHRGFGAYHWLCARLKPALWIHGHTAPAATAEWRHDWGGTTLVNATGAVLIELVANPRAAATIAVPEGASI